jgi:branched-chain amino acid transport system substrate-binding protein
MPKIMKIMEETMKPYGMLTTAIVLLSLGTAHAQISDDVVKIGVLNDQSGVYEDITGMKAVEAAKMAVEDFGGTVLGKRIEIIAGNHQNKTDVAMAIARKWIDTEQVDAIADVTGSGIALAVNELLRDKNRVMLVASAATSDLTGKACSPTTVQFSYDTYALAKSTGMETLKHGGDSWFFITADYAFGHALERDTSTFIEQGGGKVLGAVRAPLGTTDYSSFLLQAQASKAKIIGLATAGGDTITVIKQAAEFGIQQGGQRLGGLLIYINDVESLGLQTAQGLVLTTSFYWDLTDETRAWTKRFLQRTGGKKPPSMLQAGLYSSILHYLNAVQAAGTDDAKAVSLKMRELPINDFYNKNVVLRRDGRVLHDMYLAQVKTPKESTHQFDDYKILSVLPGKDAYRPEKEGGCPFVGK